MIRIDLGKGDQKGTKKKNPLLAFLSKGSGKGGKGKGKGNVKVAFGNSDIILFLVVAALATVPHFFWEQYKQSLVEKYETEQKELESSLAVIKKEAEKLGPYQRELESYQQQNRLVQQKLQVVKELLNRRSAPVAVLDALGQSLPTSGWLTNLEIMTNATAGTATVKLVGQAYRNEDISDYLDKLTDSIHLSDIKLDELSTTKADQFEVRTFKISAVPKGIVVMKKGGNKPAPTPAPAAATTAAKATTPSLKNPTSMPKGDL